jgi:hypothetical protein
LVYGVELLEETVPALRPMVFGYAVLKRDMLVLTMRTLCGITFHGEVDYEANQIIWFSTKESINLRKACRLLGNRATGTSPTCRKLFPWDASTCVMLTQGGRFSLFQRKGL